MGKPGMMFYFGDFHIISSLTDAELGALIRAAVEYAEYGTVPSFENNLMISWQLLRAAADRDSEAYKLKCKKGLYAAYCKQQKKLGLPEVSFADWINGCLPNATDDNGRIRAYTGVNQALPNQPIPNPNTKSKTNSKTNSKSERVYAPAREEIREYVAQKGYSFDPDKFFDNYNAVGWMKHGDPIVDWKSLCDNWEKTETKITAQKLKDNPFQQHGEPLSPIMRDAIKKIMEEEPEEGEQDDDTV